MKSSSWVLCGVTLLCFGSVRCSRRFTDNAENSVDKTKGEDRILNKEDTEWEVYNKRESRNDLTNELNELESMYSGPEKLLLHDDPKPDTKIPEDEPVSCEDDNDCSGNRECKGKVCVCKSGYEGDDCEEVTGCKTLKEQCDEISKACIYDEASEKATCDCGEQLKYDHKANECRTSCEDDTACSGNRECKDNFCICKSGFEGGNCETVTGCKTLKQQCDKISKECIHDKEAPEEATCDCGSDLKYDHKANECRSPCGQGKNCEGNRECNDDNLCVCIKGYEGAECTVVTGCKTLEANCKKIEKDCIFDASAPGLATCNCDDPLKYDPMANECRIPESTCNDEFSQCIPTGGKCTQESDSDGSIKCNCPLGISYDDETGCSISDEVCDEKYPKCTNTGGKCNVTTDGKSMECVCKARITYNTTTGCDITDDVCNAKQPKCKETGGTCKADQNAVKCDCPEGFLYKANSGCLEDKCFAKCGIPYKKTNDMLRCAGDPFGNVDCKCKNTTLTFDSRDKTCKVTYCKKVCGGKPRVKCGGDIFDEEKVECNCNGEYYDFVKDDDKKECKLNYCKQTCGTDKGVKCEEDNYTPKAKKDCICEENGHEYNGKKCQLACSEDSECENGAKCNPKGNSKFCECKKGTEGDTCSVIKDCEAGGTYAKCKDGKGECLYDVTGRAAICKCSEGQQLYKAQGYCDVQCKDDGECGDRKTCNSDKFCVCKKGYEGDDCETITGCKTLKAKCDKIKKECIFAEGAPGSATCDCGEGYGYDWKANECRLPCSKDKKCDGNRVCNSDNFCICKSGYEGAECNEVTGCKKLEEKCKKINTECIFDEKASDKATCKCEEDFTYSPKENECKSAFCYPKNPCPSTANCTVHETTRVGYCLCPENQFHDQINNKCQEFGNKCLLRKTPCDKNHKCNGKTGECECKDPVKKDEECKPKLCKGTKCVVGADCSETDGNCYCKDGKYFNGKTCKDTCNLKDYKKNCTCPTDTEKKDGGECVAKKEDEKCDTDCGYGICVKKGKTEYCRCFNFARNVGGKCTLLKSFCASQKSEGELQEGSMKCKCEGLYKQADDGITCVFKTCDDDDVKEECATIGGECVMDWKKGYDCKCLKGYEKDKNANGKCTDPCSIENFIKDCSNQDKFCYNTFSTKGEMTSTCGCPPTAKEETVNGIKRCSGKAEYSYLIKNILVLKKEYVLKSGINKLLLNADLISSLRQTYKKDIFDYGYLYDYKVQGDVVNCSVWINFKSAPSKTELDKIKVAGKKFSGMCDECDEAVVWPPSLLLSAQGLTEAVPETLEFCKPEVKDRVCGKGASCAKDETTGASKCFCDEGYKLIEYSLKSVGNSEVARCEDVDECADGTHTCSGNTICRNTFGSYSCVCKDGFKKKVTPSDPETDKSDCVDMCTNSPCKKGKCVLKGNSFDCQCQAGAAGSLCDREDENYKSAKKSTVVVGAVLGTILAVGAIAVLYYIVKRKKRSGSEDFMPAARLDHAEMTERRHMRGVTNKAYE